MEVCVSWDMSPLMLQGLVSDDERLFVPTQATPRQEPRSDNPFDSPPPIEFVRKWTHHIQQKQKKFGKATDFEVVWLAAAGRCVYCLKHVWAYNIPLAEGNYSGTIDHVVPRGKGGPNALDNKVCACRLCNNLKSDKSVEEFGSPRIGGISG